jgi:hypothetical protein
MFLKKYLNDAVMIQMRTLYPMRFLDYLICSYIYYTTSKFRYVPRPPIVNTFILPSVEAAGTTA